jgi:tRNA(Arg) A34 adenosine deaminase TadA
VDRHIAAKYGFDDKVFYDEVDSKAGIYGLRRSGYIIDTSNPNSKAQSERVEKNMVEIHNGILRESCEALFQNPTVNRSLKRRYSRHTADLHEAAKKAFPEPILRNATTNSQHEMYMQMAIDAAQRGVKGGVSKEREPFGTVIVKDGVVIAQACNTVTSSKDCTSTSEVNAIVAACANLGTYNLEGCDMYTVAQPDVMSLGAILWSRMSRVYCGVTQQFAAQYGFEEASVHFQDLQLPDKAHRVCEVVEGVSVEECEQVFREWSDRNGVIY